MKLYNDEGACYISGKLKLLLQSFQFVVNLKCFNLKDTQVNTEENVILEIAVENVRNGA